MTERQKACGHGGGSWREGPRHGPRLLARRRTLRQAIDEAGSFAALWDVRDPTRPDSDRVAQGAFDLTIKRWQDSGEAIPLHWSETPSFRYRVGSLDPATLRDEGGLGLFVEGSLDLEGKHRAEADHAWTAIKCNEIDVQVDYTLVANDEANGVRTLQELDLTELTLRPTSKGRAEIKRQHTASLRELRRKSDELQVEVALGCTLDEFRRRKTTQIASPRDAGPPTIAELRERAAELGLELTRLDTVRAEARKHMISLLLGAEDAA